MSSAAAPSSSASLLPLVSAVRVSSVLNNAVAEYGKRHLLDGSSDTCWNSAQGSPQFVQLTFAQPVDVLGLTVSFQGGFVGRVDSQHSQLRRAASPAPQRQTIAHAAAVSLCCPAAGAECCAR